MDGRSTAERKRVNRRMYAVWRAILCFMARLLYRYRLSGRKNIPIDGPFILAFNHLHMFDAVVMAPVTKRQIVPFAAKKWESKGLAGWFLKKIGTVFVKRGEVDRRALRDSLAALRSGYPLALAPEGTRSKTATMQEARPGVAFMASRERVPIVPVAQFGVEKIGQWKRLRRPTSCVFVGKPFYLPVVEKPSTAVLKSHADLIMLRIALDLPETYRGVYAERARAIEEGLSNELDVLIPLEA